MLRKSESTHRPRNGRKLVVAIVARISGCVNQKELSLDDQVDHAKQIVGDLYSGPVEYRIIATRGKGERLDRPELEQIQAELRKGELDLLVMEDMGRLVRGPEAIRLFGMGVDHGVRCISPNDRVDTINDTWEEDALAACRDHVSYNAQTSRRLKHKLTNRFEKFGGATPCPIAGYIVPDDAKTYADWRKVEPATAFIKEGAQILRETLNGEAVAAYFNNVPYNGGIGFPVGPHCRRTSWYGPMVLRFYRNTLLSGRPRRGMLHSIKHYETGRRISVPNPGGPVVRHEPHLAHLTTEEQDELIALLNKRNAHFKRKGQQESDPCWRVKRKDSRWPGQAGGVCWYCGSPVVWGGNGITGNLMCSGSRAGRCWNSVGFNGQLALQQLVAEVMSQVEKLPEIDGQLRDLVERADATDETSAGNLAEKLRREEADLVQLKSKLEAAIKAYGVNEIVDRLMAEYREREANVKIDKAKLSRQRETPNILPATAAELHALFRDEFARAGHDSANLGRLLRQLVPEFHFYLVQMCTGGPPLPRIRAHIRLDGVIRDAERVEGLSEVLSRHVTLDVFSPSPRELVRLEAVRLARLGTSLCEIVRKISSGRERGIGPLTVKGALALQEEMDLQGLPSPYMLLCEPPKDYHKLRRHRSAKYRFEPVSGYIPPTLDE